MGTQDVVTDTSVVSYEMHEDVAVLRIDNPPVNSSSAAVRSGLLVGIARARADDDVKAVVLIGAAGGNFISGSDLKEFSVAELPKPELPEVIAALENLPKPTIAALSGATLGGGLELALGCDYRIAAAGTVIGLPEATLGMIPGAGGTQRSLRLLGAAATIPFVCDGVRRTVTVQDPTAFIDEVTTSDLTEAAVRFARAAEGKKILRNLPVLKDEPGAIEKAVAKALAKSKGRPNIISAIGAILAGTQLSVGQGLAHERAEFTRLRNSAEAGALRHQFFARRAVAKANRAPKGTEVRKVSIVGAGTMGMGIARAFAESGIEVNVFDENLEAAQASLGRVHKDLEKLVGRGYLNAEASEATRERLTVVATAQELSGADLFIEAVFEDLEIKRQVLSSLEDLADGAVLATNTSYLDVDELATVLHHPERLVGMHFFSPAHRTQVIEVVRAAQTGQPAMDIVFAAAKALGKTPVVARVCDGFIGNRIYNAYRRQCELMLEEGAMPEQVDRALVDFGFAMGPFAVSDMSGLDIAWRMRRSKDATRDPLERYPLVADALCEIGRFGQKTGAGWYSYSTAKPSGSVDPVVTELILEASNRQGLERREFSDEQIVRRALMSMANEAALLLKEGIAERPGDIDVMLVLGYGFPAHKGGISQWVDTEPGVLLDAELRELGRVSGQGFKEGDLELLAP